MKKTKMVCTIGPASEQKDQLEALINAGMNVMRMNFSHGDHVEQGFRIKNVKALNAEKGWNIGIMLDTKGPEIRTGYLKNDEPVMLTEGNTIRITMDYSFLGDANKVAISYPGLYDDISVGGRILIEDGNLTLTVTEKDEANHELVCRIENSRKLKNKRNCNVPGVILNMDYIAPKDKDDIDHDLMIDNVLSYPNEKNEIDAIGLAVAQVANNFEVAAVVAEGDQELAFKISQYRPATDVFFATKERSDCRSLQLAWGVQPVCGKLEDAYKAAVAALNLEAGDSILEVTRDGVKFTQVK